MFDLLHELNQSFHSLSIPSGSCGSWSQSQLIYSERWGTPWAGLQSFAGLTQRRKENPHRENIQPLYRTSPGLGLLLALREQSKPPHYRSAPLFMNSWIMVKSIQTPEHHIHVCHTWKQLSRMSITLWFPFTETEGPQLQTCLCSQRKVHKDVLSGRSNHILMLSVWRAIFNKQIKVWFSSVYILLAI